MRLSIGNSYQIFFTVSTGALLSLGIPTQQVVLAESSPSFNCYKSSAGERFTRLELPSGVQIDLIVWKRSHNPRKKCQNASDKFQDFFDGGKLNFIKSGEVPKTGRRMICGVAKENDECNNESKLFDLLEGETPAKVLADDLLNRLNSHSNSGEPIYQGSGDEILIDFQKLLKQLNAGRP
jgi:Circadian oscillating protein COP23